MSRTQESGAYLGGIGTMLGDADVCASCGQAHADQKFALRHGEPRECPRVVFGSFPVMSRPDPDPLEELPVRVPVARQIREFEIPPPVALGSLPIARREPPAPRARALSAPWLLPPDLGEVL